MPTTLSHAAWAIKMRTADSFAALRSSRLCGFLACRFWLRLRRVALSCGSPLSRGSAARRFLRLTSLPASTVLLPIPELNGPRFLLSMNIDSGTQPSGCRTIGTSTRCSLKAAFLSPIRFMVPMRGKKPWSLPMNPPGRARGLASAHSLLPFIAAALVGISLVNTEAEEVYTFTTLAGLAGGLGSADGTGSAARFNPLSAWRWTARATSMWRTHPTGRFGK